MGIGMFRPLATTLAAARRCVLINGILVTGGDSSGLAGKDAAQVGSGKRSSVAAHNSGACQQSGNLLPGKSSPTQQVEHVALTPNNAFDRYRPDTQFESCSQPLADQFEIIRRHATKRDANPRKPQASQNATIRDVSVRHKLPQNDSSTPVHQRRMLSTFEGS